MSYTSHADKSSKQTQTLRMAVQGNHLLDGHGEHTVALIVNVLSNQVHATCSQGTADSAPLAVSE